MKSKKRLIVLTGAGMSAESGISTFRGAGGLWNNERIEDVATPNAWYKNPQKVLDFYNFRRRELVKATPNKGHHLLVDFEKKFDVFIITQNVDNLHERAGSSNVLHLHGELMKVRSMGNENDIFELNLNNIEINIGDNCPDGFQLRPHIVWFGEAVPEIENAINLVETADIFLIIGTSMQVYPAAGLINYLPINSTIYLIDPDEILITDSRIHHIQKGASEGLKIFYDLISK